VVEQQTLQINRSNVTRCYVAFAIRVIMFPKHTSLLSHSRHIAFKRTSIPSLPIPVLLAGAATVANIALSERFYALLTR
jgi:hypothetical protein